ncbi:hypothetical protein VNO78_10460 [Psophocarpus tetragonolobus]|uniref:Uncharacterized protein n=1 Tax=Psophocarpus tetragonolobus TaxID=3891 RepID=A0AAN9XMR5_PSOTE
MRPLATFPRPSRHAPLRAYPITPLSFLTPLPVSEEPPRNRVVCVSLAGLRDPPVSIGGEPVITERGFGNCCCFLSARFENSGTVKKNEDSDLAM